MIDIKIYLGNKPIILTKEVADNQIPLAYLNDDEKIYTIHSKEVNAPSGIKKLIPYETFDTYEKAFFKSNMNSPSTFEDLIPTFAGDYLKRISNKYVYTPKSSVKFQPLHFTYKILGKRNWLYDINKIYNVKIGCIAKNANYAKSLISIFGNAGDRNIVPKNVFVNNKDISVNSLQSGTMQEKDFVFIETADGKNAMANGQPIPYSSLLDGHTNIWLSYPTIKTLEKGISQLNDSILYKNKTQVNEGNFIISDFSTTNLPAGGIIMNFFSTKSLACIVMHYPGKGFIIASSENVILKASENYCFIYEMLMQIYLKSYVLSDEYHSFIADYPVDYIVKNFNIVPFDTFKSEKPYYELLGVYRPEEFTLINVIFSTPQVELIDSRTYLYFKKTGVKTDPVKTTGSISIYLETNDVCYTDEWLYTTNTVVPIIFEKQEDSFLAKIGAFCNSHVYNPSMVTLELPLMETVNYENRYFTNVQYFIVCSEGILKAVLKNNIKINDIILVEINIQLTKANISLIDMRMRGGGLPEGKKNNYDLLDIGFYSGRQFRKGGSYIVYLPLSMKPFHSRIEETLKKYTVADHYFSIIYENREDDIFESQ